MSPLPPVVLTLSGHDPTGGAGIQADIETLSHLGCHPCTVITALTVQDTRNVSRVLPQAPEDFLEQARFVLADLPVAAVKIGLLGSRDIAEAAAQVLDQLDGSVPVVLDPILAAGGGLNLADSGLVETVRRRLAPRALLMTPNIPEAQRLTGEEDYDPQGRALLDLGCPHILLTGAHANSPDVINRWYSGAGVKSYRWPRLPAAYHGSGCTLASAAAACLAKGMSVEAAIQVALGYTWRSLHSGYALGQGQLLPNRGCA
jgi:hydroxymethylpyrimidine/phosphomethylpyrimidine kinase